MIDEQTRDYFDRFTPHYGPKRFDFAIEYLNRHANSSQKLIDIGCGDGATLYLIKEKTPLIQLAGLDISKNSLNDARELTGCDMIEGSILDRAIINKYAHQFDYCTLKAVIHHLIGKTRAESFRYASRCLENSLKLLKPDGCLIIYEPTHAPSSLMDIVFWTKKTISRFTNQRIELLKGWVNFGLPVVSYYTPKQMHSFIEDFSDARMLDEVIVAEKRLAFIIKRVDLGIIVKKMEPVRGTPLLPVQPNSEQRLVRNSFLRQRTNVHRPPSLRA
jgi:SAM-dependent methyltransferase